jgi:hypothetical protein
MKSLKDYIDSIPVQEDIEEFHDRVSAAIEAKKQEVGASMLGMSISTEDVQLEEKEEGHEDEAEDKAMCKDVAKKEVKGHEKRMHKGDKED